MNLIVKGVLLAGLAGAAGLSAAGPMTYDLPPETAALRPAAGAGYEAAVGNCLVCHSADYVETQPPNKGKAFWDGEVTKMINVYKARITPEDAKAIADYLAENH